MLLFILFVGCILIFYKIGKSAEKHIKQCVGKHSWIIRFENNDKKGYLICKACGKIPGED